MPPASRIGDMHVCPKVEPGPVPHVGGVVVSGAGTVLIGYMPAARVGDTELCNAPPDSVSQGESSVIIQGALAARLGDGSSHGGLLVAGCPTVIIGSSTQAQTIQIAASNGTPFCEECEKKPRDADAGAEGQSAPSASASSPGPVHRQIFYDIQRTVDRKAAAIDRWLRRSNKRYAVVYRQCQTTRPNFAALIRGRIIDVTVRQWVKKKYGRKVNGQELLADSPVEGSGRLRPDFFLGDCEGERLLLEVGGASKRVDKYAGLAERIYILYTPPAK
jgi:uncharacterized Zn-binding protein involved in type VI secretion